MSVPSYPIMSYAPERRAYYEEKYIPNPQKLSDEDRKRLFHTPIKGKPCHQGIKCQFVYENGRCYYTHSKDEIRFFENRHEEQLAKAVIEICRFKTKCNKQFDYFMGRSTIKCRRYHTDENNIAIKKRADIDLKHIAERKERELAVQRIAEEKEQMRLLQEYEDKQKVREALRRAYQSKMAAYECKFYGVMGRQFMARLESLNYIFGPDKYFPILHLIAIYCFDVKYKPILKKQPILGTEDGYKYRMTPYTSEIEHHVWTPTKRVGQKNVETPVCASCITPLMGSCLCNYNTELGFHLWCFNNVLGKTLPVDPLNRFICPRIEHNHLKYVDIRETKERFWSVVEFPCVLGNNQFPVFLMSTYKEHAELVESKKNAALKEKEDESDHDESDNDMSDQEENNLKTCTLCGGRYNVSRFGNYCCGSCYWLSHGKNTN